jgi:hypothetical protein
MTNNAIPGRARKKTKRKGTLAGFSVVAIVKIRETTIDIASTQTVELRNVTAPSLRVAYPRERGTVTGES